MSLAPLLEPLRRVAIFQGLRPLQITEIARRAERVTFEPGDTIIEAGKTGDAAYVIVSGNAVRTKGPSPAGAKQALGPGTLVGEMAMLVETSYTSTIVCQEQTTALKITREALLDQMASDLALVDHILEKLAGRLKELADDLKKVHETLATEGDLWPTFLDRALPAPVPAAQEAHN